MEVSMDTSPGLSPIPQQSFPTSPAGSRKRSIQDLDDSTTSEFKKPSIPSHPENQENNAPVSNIEPTSDTPTQSTPPKPLTETNDGKPAEVAVEIRVPNQESGSKQESNPTAAGSAESALTAIPNPNTTMDNNSSSTGQPPGSSTPAAKKRKLSPASKEAKQQEKEAKQQEKEAKERQKQEDKVKKEEEKAKKEEEKRVKEEEKKKRDVEREEERKRKEEKKKVKEEEKAAKEEEKRKKDEEKSKKERAQMKLNSFFAKPKSPAQPSNTSSSASPKKASGDGASNEPAPEPVSTVSDYQRQFPDFFLQSHTTVAPPHRFERDAEALRHMREKVDTSLKLGDRTSQEPLAFRPNEIFHMMPYRRRHGRQSGSIKEILLKIQSLGDSTGLGAIAEAKPGSRPQDLLKGHRMKSFRFGEDVRPPYQGTYSKPVPVPSAKKLSRNPFHRGLPDTNYDYDSEAEWEEPEEGEDLDSEEEEEGSEDGEDDLDGFLDDDDDNQIDGKRRLIVGDLEPVCTGIRWQGNSVDPDLQMYKMETIAEGATFPIDPFSTAYWQKPKAAEPAPGGGAGRSTLHAFMTNSSAPNGSSTPMADGTGLALLSKARRPFPPEQLPEFKQVVDGSDLTKTGLVEILKKR
ncbi:hypothetical protein AWENTII_002660 [Aspergillus wentii]|nr:hypothetical protein MW887_007777 [Aspergillus wentii]